MSYDVEKMKAESRFISDICYVEACESTNALAKERALSDVPEGFTVIADEQTMGRGRLGRKWIHQGKSAIAMSIVLRPDMKLNDVSRITLAAALAVHDAIKDVAGLETDIKWPNDIYHCGRKICGILTEGRIDGNRVTAVLGIGINVNTEKFDESSEDLKNAASIKAFTGENVDRGKLIVEIADAFGNYYEILRSDGDMRRLMDKYNESAMQGNKIDKNGNPS